MRTLSVDAQSEKRERAIDALARLHHAPFTAREAPAMSPQNAAAVITDPHRRVRAELGIPPLGEAHAFSA